MHDDLVRHYEDALADADRRAVRGKVSQLEALLRSSVATINIPPKLLYSLALGQEYVSYYRAVAAGQRRIAELTYHAHRGAVDAKVHTGYEAEILNAAVSPDGRGLTNYGAVTLQLREFAIDQRASVLRENAFGFYERYDLGRRDATEEPGWRSNWVERGLLGVAQLADTVTSAMPVADLPEIVLSSGAGRDDDRYMEVHIYGTLPREALDRVTLDRPLTDADDREAWEFGCSKLPHHGIAAINRVGA